MGGRNLAACGFKESWPKPNIVLGAYLPGYDTGTHVSFRRPVSWPGLHDWLINDEDYLLNVTKTSWGEFGWVSKNPGRPSEEGELGAFVPGIIQP